MTRPDMTVVGAELYDAVAPLTYADESLGWPLALYLSANGLMLEEVAALVRASDDGSDGWTAFADPARCPDSFLYTLGVWAGVRFPRRMTLSDLRDIIGPQAPGVWRGTKGAILSAVRRYLVEGSTIFFEERADGNAYHLRIFTYDSETLNEDAIRDELLGAIPAGLVVNYEVREGQTYDQLEAGVTSYDDMSSTWSSYDEVTHSMSPDAAQGK